MLLMQLCILNFNGPGKAPRPDEAGCRWKTTWNVIAASLRLAQLVPMILRVEKYSTLAITPRSEWEVNAIVWY